ncbi:MAG: leader peptidase (prepilin peptidase) / N-methyltransferase [Frankiales bacterium]|nr:leader peptidase (prepilin peptidase) / N-methyltransferase [Frankiales bacterium]
MNAFLLTWVAVLGLIIGSFLNVVVWRLPRQENLSHPGSHCPRCQHPIRPYDNLPVLSWLLLRRRCRDCKAPISARYPAVELATGALFLLIAWRIGWHLSLAGYLFFTATGVALALIDYDVKRLPDALTFPTYVVAIAALAADSAHRGQWSQFARAVEGMAALFAFYLATRVLGTALMKKTAMGLGDVKLSGILGLLLGWLSWGALVVGAFAGFLVGALGGIALIASGKGKLATRIPYGPYMLLGALVGILWGAQIAHWYVHLSGG